MSGLALETLENSFHSWIKDEVPNGWAVVWADQNAPKAGEKVLTLRRGNPYVVKIGRDIQGPVDPDTLTAPRAGTREIHIALRAFGPECFQLLSDLLARFDDEDAIDALVAGAIAVVGWSQAVQNLTQLYGSQHRQVAQVELVLRTHSLRIGADAEAGVSYIESVDLTVRAVHPDGTHTDEETVVDSTP